MSIPTISVIPSLPPTAYVAPRERQIQRAVMSGCPAEPFVNVSHHADTTTMHATRSSCGFSANKPVYDAEVSRPTDENYQISSSLNLPVSRPSKVAKMMSAPSRYDIVCVPTITVDGRYPIIFSSSSKHDAAAASSWELPATAVGAVISATHQEYDLLAPLPVSKSESSALIKDNNIGGNVPGSLTSLPHAKQQSMLAYHHLP